MRVHKGLERQKQTLAKTSFVRAAGGSRNQIYVALAHGCAGFAPAHHPVCTLVHGKRLIVFFSPPLRFERIKKKRLGEFGQQIFSQTSVVAPGQFLPRLFVDIANRTTRKQNGLTLQQADELLLRNRRRIKILGIRQTLNARTRVLFAASGRLFGKRFRYETVSKADVVLLAVAPNRDVQMLTQGVGHRDTDAMQTARKAIGAA